MGSFGSCLGGKSLPDCNINFNDPVPASEVEGNALKKFQDEVLSQTQRFLERIGSYEDKNAIIGPIVATPSDDSSQIIVDTLYNSVRIITECYDFSVIFSKGVVEILKFLIAQFQSNNSLRILESFQASLNALAEAFQFSIKFDEIKMQKPKLMNDLSFFKRALGKGVIPKDQPNFDTPTFLQESSSFGVFYAQGCPMTSSLCDACIKQFPDDDPKPSIVFGYLTDLCTSSYLHGTGNSEVVKLKILHALTDLILITDHISKFGVFIQKSPIRIIDATKVLTEHQPKQQGLINLVKYSSKHFNDPTTLPEIKLKIK